MKNAIRAAIDQRMKDISMTVDDRYIYTKKEADMRNAELAWVLSYIDRLEHYEQEEMAKHCRTIDEFFEAIAGIEE